MNNAKIQLALSNLFEKQRIVFWYDTRQEFRADFAALEVHGVEKIELANNEFGLKHRVLRQQPDQKFLLYRHGPEPAHLENWLLDVQLASGNIFRTDQVALWLAELDDYEGDVIYPLATQQIEIDLDDGVKVNYLKFGTALKKIVGLEAKDED